MKNIMPPINTPDKSFHDGNPATGEQGTIVSAEWLNNAQGSIRNTQQELVSVLTEAGIAIDENKTNQLLLAILNLITDRSPDLPVASTLQKGIVQLSSAINSTSEALAATPKAVKAALDASLPVGGTAASATKLATARKIGGVDFDGTKDITLPFISTTDTNIQLAGNLTAQGTQILLQGDDRKHLGFHNQDGSVRMWLYKDKGGDGVRLNNGNDGGGDWLFHKNGNLHAPAGIFAGGNITVSWGGRTATFHENGDVTGPIWGGALSAWLNNTFVRDIRFGHVQEVQIFRGPGYRDEPPHVITGVINFNTDEYPDFVQRRAMQKNINGNWINVWFM